MNNGVNTQDILITNFLLKLTGLTDTTQIIQTFTSEIHSILPNFSSKLFEGIAKQLKDGKNPNITELSAGNNKNWQKKADLRQLQNIVSIISALINSNNTLKITAEEKAIKETLLNQRSNALNNSEKLFTAVLEKNLQAFVMVDNNIIITKYNLIANNYFEENFGCPLQKGVCLRDLVTDKKLQAGFDNHIEKALNGEVIEVDVPTLIKDNPKWYRFQYYPVGLDGGTIRSVCITAVDISNLKNFEQELLKAKEMAEESDRLKTAFLANMSHELRTPMNGIIGFSEMLAKQDLNSDRKEYYSKIIQNSCQQLLTIVNDILDISRIETGKMDVRSEVFSINDVISALYNQFSAKSKLKGVELIQLQAAEKKESYIESDKGKLTQILSNLLSNAFKFTHNGQIKFGYYIEKQELIFFVEDSGIGIPTHLHQKIFDRFRQGEVETTRKYGGTGLGLSISFKLAEMLGGKIWVESEPGKGSVFFVKIPYNQIVIKEIPAQNDKPQLSNANKIDNNKNISTILIAEDEETNFIYLEELFSEYNYNLLHAWDGVEAIELCHKHPEIDLVLMDIKMPRLSGLEATKTIKGFRPNLPIIAQTAFAMESDKQKAIAVGCDAHITKPIIEFNLFSTIKKFIGK